MADQIVGNIDSSTPIADVADDFYVVGIGASAGGLDPIERFFDKTPPDTGMAYVIVQHLSPDFKSLMDELLSRHTEMPIHRVEDGMRIQPNHIYLIPPKKNMMLSHRKLLLTDQDRGGVNLPIDIFFRSLAEDVGQRAVAVILSGTGSDGTRGIQNVHDIGGLVLAQDLESAGFDGMPRSAASTDVVDVVCPPELMPQKIAEYLDNPNGFQRGQLTMDDHLDQAGELFELFRIFRHKFGIDFSLYKSATIHRRIERRMHLSREQDLQKYTERLESDTGELDALYRDLLVEVTQFFRDPEAFKSIKNEVVPELVRNATSDTELRVWVPGCATGEEAYSLAMIFLAEIQAQEKQTPLKVFATDVHPRSLEYASSAVYPAGALEHVPEEFQTRFFTAHGELFHITRDLRQSVIFAPNDITRDPPFTKIDLISCRNVLIYLEPRVQKKVLSLFHFGLKTGGVLFLGPSETLGDLSSEFETVDRHWRIYRKQRDVRLPMATRLPMPPALSRVVSTQPAFIAKSPISTSNKSLTTAYDELLAKYVPPSLLVNEYFELVHSFGDARELLVQPEGRPTLDVLKLVQGDLRMALSAALHKVNRENSTVVYKGVRLKISKKERQYKVVVEPFSKSNAKMFLICLEEIERPELPPPSVEEFDVQAQSNERITVLEQELTYTRESLQSTVEELETSNEELQSTNEELVASNEELQSTNEELHSVNEELYTVNAEHKQKIEELTQLTSDLDNLMKSTEIGAVFLDRELRIRMFTSAISNAFSVLEQDVGRPIDHIAYKLDHPNLLGDIRSVLASGDSVAREVRAKDRKVYLQRIRPYQSAQGGVDGITITFTDISAVKEVEQVRKKTIELSQANSDLQEFAYAVSHDLQAPLRHIRDASSRLAVELEDQVEGDCLLTLNELSESSDSMSRMIQGLLSYSRIATRGGAFVETNCEDLLDEVLQDRQMEVNNFGGKIIRGKMPIVEADGTQLRHVFDELIRNAIKYSSNRPLEIKIDCENKNGEWVFSVSDNGIGIAPRHSERAFVIFQRIGTKPDAIGDGLGLALCKRIIERHGGRIWLDSAAEIGTTFYFSLPC